MPEHVMFVHFVFVWRIFPNGKHLMSTTVSSEMSSDVAQRRT